MKTIFLISADGQLAARIGTALSRAESVLRLTPFPSALTPPGAWHNAIVVVDCRGLSRVDTESTITRVRSVNTQAFRCVALVGGTPERRMDVIGRGSRHDFDVVLSEHDHIGMTLRAMLNDADGSVGAAIALASVREHLETVATQIAEAVLSSGCRISSVGAVEKALGKNRSDLGDYLIAEGSPSPKQIVRLVRAAYAVVLLRRTNLTFGKIAERIGYSASRWMQGLLVSELGARAEELQARTPEMAIEDFLEELLVDWEAGATRSGGGA